jgi:hypothetical protein
MSGSRFLFSSNYLEGDQEDLSLSIHSEQLNAFLSLVEQYGNFHLCLTPEGYILDIGKYKFKLDDSPQQCKLSLLAVVKLYPEAAELCAKLAAVLFAKYSERLKLQTRNLDELKLLWEQCRLQKLKPIATNKAQQDQFNEWEKQAQPQAQPMMPAKTSSNQQLLFSMITPVTPINETSLGFLFSQADQSGEIALYVETGRFIQLLEMAERYGNFYLTKTPQGLMIDIGQYKFTATHHVNLLRLSLINLSRLQMGAAELAAKVARLLFSENPNHVTLDFKKAENGKLLWQQCRQLGLKLAANKQAQQQLFAEWDTEYRLAKSQTQISALRSPSQPESPADNNPSIDKP